MKKFIKRLIMALILLVFPLSLASCTDLGTIQNEEEYGEKLAAAFITSDNNRTDFISMDQFYNKETSDNFSSPISENEYKYMIVKNKSDSDIRFGDFFFYVNPNKDITLEYKAYILAESAIPTSFLDMDDSYKKLKEYLEKKAAGEDATLDLPTNNEPGEADAIAKGKSNVKANQRNWNDIRLDLGKSCIIPKGDCLVLQFINNTGVGIEFSEDMDLDSLNEQIENRKKSMVSINITNIIIEVKS